MLQFVLLKQGDFKCTFRIIEFYSCALLM